MEDAFDNLLNEQCSRSLLYISIQCSSWSSGLCTLRLRQTGCHIPDDIFKCIFLNENVCILIKISLKFVPKGPINNIPALVQIMAWHRPGDKPLSVFKPRNDGYFIDICVSCVYVHHLGLMRSLWCAAQMGHFWGSQSPYIWVHFWRNVLRIGSYILSSSLQLGSK